jgi:hypothetical protein
MGYLYGVTTKLFRDDLYKLGMTLCKDEAELISYLTKRYNTPYGCLVEIVLFKKVGNPRAAEKHLQNSLKEYLAGGEVYNCAIEIIQKALDTVPETDEVVKKPTHLTVSEAVAKYTKVPREFVEDFGAIYDKDTLPTDFVVNVDQVAKWLHSSKRGLCKTIRATYNLNKDYIKSKFKDPRCAKSNHCVKYMLTPDCVKKICMATASKNGPIIRQYFIEIEQMYTKHHKQLLKPNTKEPRSEPAQELTRVSITQDNVLKHITLVVNQLTDVIQA